MPTRDEILQHLLDQNEEILARLDRIEQAKGNDPWLQDFDLAGTDTPEDERDSVLPRLPGRPSKEAKDAWEAQAETICENIEVSPEKGLLLPPDAAALAYKAGGPLWLAAYDHDFLMGLPQGMRQQMVEQVNTYDPEAGAELARDILRADAESSKLAAYDVALQHADARASAR